MKSDLRGFYNLEVEERLKLLKKEIGLTDDDIKILFSRNLDVETANIMIENVVGVAGLPLGIATYFRINKKDYLIPMAIEEPSVVAAASNAAKLCRPEGFTSSATSPIMEGQIQLINIKDPEKAANKIIMNRKSIIKKANEKDSVLIKLGGGAKDISSRVINTKRGNMVIIHIIVDVRDAMGANCVNTMAENITPLLEEISGGKARLRIISNLAVKRLARARAVWKKEVIGPDIIEGILDAYAFAEADHFRCTTHNKGIMNGIDAVMIATGNDFRAIEAGAHGYAALDGYHSLTKYEKDRNGNLVGSIELPIAAGIVGGSIKTNPTANLSLKIMGIRSASELAQIAACVGLANNFAAMHAMVREGIQKGHMRLHAKNLAVLAGANGEMIEKISSRMIKDGKVTATYAMELLKNRRKK
jgi:hydroxymethylglutaryl-CoA reductase